MTAHISPTDLHVLDTEPRVHDLRLAEALEFGQPYGIRKLINGNLAELATHGEVFAAAAKTPPSGGRPGTEYWLNEPQAVLVCMFARTAKAADVRKEIIEVFLAWRRGRLNAAAATVPFYDFPAEGGPLAVYAAKLATIRETRIIHGLAAARRVWDTLDMPPVAGAGGVNDDAARRCLRTLLEADAFDDAHGAPVSVGRAVEAALDDDLTGELNLRSLCAIRILREGDAEGFVVANGAPFLERVFAGTGWDKGRWPYVLRRLPGAHVSKRCHFGHGQHRGTFVPGDLLEIMAAPARIGLPALA